MATWKITVRDTMTYNGVNLEKGMFVEYTNPTLDHPIFKTMHHDAVNQLFKTKYGIDLKKIGFINETRFVVEKIR
jgi:hypothetical protein